MSAFPSCRLPGTRSPDSPCTHQRRHRIVENQKSCELNCDFDDDFNADPNSDSGKPSKGQDSFLLKEVFLYSLGSLPALRNGPDHQGLAAAHVTGGKNPGETSHVPPIGFEVAARVQPNAQLLDHPVVFRMDKSHRQQDQVGPDFGTYQLQSSPRQIKRQNQYREIHPRSQ